MSDDSDDPAVAIRRLVDGYQVSQAIHVAATLGIADLLAAGARSSDELAAATDADATSMYRLLRALASVGVLHESEGREFELTELGEQLRTDVEESIAGWAAFIGTGAYWSAWGDLLHSVRTGENAFRHVHGTDVWTHRSTRPDDNAIFGRAMASSTRRTTGALMAAYDFSGFATIADIGGGTGALIGAILAATPESRGILFDQPHVVAGAPEVLSAIGVADRCEIVAGSFFEAVPAGADAYTMRTVLHDWSDEDGARILRVVRQAMPDHSRLLVIERVIAPPNEGRFGKFSDLNMLVAPGGRERTRDEFATLFEQGGFRLAEVVPADQYSYVVGEPAA
jgi:hypothetical protein